MGQFYSLQQKPVGLAPKARSHPIVTFMVSDVCPPCEAGQNTMCVPLQRTIKVFAFCHTQIPWFHFETKSRKSVLLLLRKHECQLYMAAASLTNPPKQVSRLRVHTAFRLLNSNQWHWRKAARHHGGHTAEDSHLYSIALENSFDYSYNIASFQKKGNSFPPKDFENFVFSLLKIPQRAKMLSAV